MHSAGVPVCVCVLVVCVCVSLLCVLIYCVCVCSLEPRTIRPYSYIIMYCLGHFFVKCMDSYVLLDLTGYSYVQLLQGHK